MTLKHVFILWLLPLLAVRAQVTVQVLIPPPYSPYLYDYQEQYADRNAIVLTNASRVNTTIMLRGELRGRTNGIRVYTSPSYRPARPIDLLAGQSQRFTLAESNQDYLDRKNLEVSGVDDATRNQILTSGLLPPGSYDFCVLAYRYDNGQPVGTPIQGCTFLRIAYLEPPRLTQPLCGRDLLIRPNEPNQTLFSWNPPVGNIAGSQIVYDFYLVKVPPGQNPNDAINNAIDRRVGNPFIERDLTTTFLNYGVAEPPLTEGQYAWRVVARDPDHRTVFQNQGRSEYCPFTTRNVATPLNDAIKPVLAQGQPGQKPVVLPPGQMKVMSNEAPVGPCRDVAAPTDKTPVAANYQNQTVTIGKFDLTIDDITTVGNAYSGRGRVRWNGLPMRVSFTTIQINAARQVVAGEANGIDDAFRMPGVNLGSTDLNGLQNLDGTALKTYADNLRNNLFDQAKSALAVPLPLGYDAGSGLIGINYMRFTPTGADMGLVFTMELPEANSYLALAGVGICMAPDKIIPNNALLYLLKDLKVPFTPLTFLKGNLSFIDPTGTFAELTTADGLKRVHGELALNLGSGFLQLDDGNGNVQPGDVTATLKADFTKWADWVADVQLPPFALSPLSGFTFRGVSVQYDHSDLRNPAGFAPPAEYTGERGPTFQGVYLAELQTLLPKSFAGQSGNRTGFAAKECLFTGGEFTGRLTPATKPLLKYATGSLGNWGFSIEEFEVLFVQNRFERGGMNGNIQFPISTDQFTYSTTLRDNFKNIQLVVKPKTGGYNIPLWAATMNIAEASHILVGLQNSTPVMDMQLTGNLLINTGKVPKVIAMVLPNLYFENLIVSNLNKPGSAGNNDVYVNPGNWKLVGGIFKDDPANTPAPGARKGGGPADPELTDDVPAEWINAPGNEGGLAGFPIEIAPPKAVADAHGFGVELGAYVSLSDASAHIMNASGFVRIMGKMDLDGKRPKPVFGGVYPSRFGVKGNFGAGSIDAAIDIYDQDSKYGTGFKGVGKVAIPALTEVEATVQFGKVSGFYYAYADASVILTTGIPIAPPTPLVLNGLGGGFYYNMVPEKLEPVTTIIPQNAPNIPLTGHTNSGTGYRPQSGGWGIKARVYVAMADAHLMTSSLEVEASFAGGALNRFRLTGLANMLDADGSIKTLDDALEKILRAEFVHDVAQKSYNLSIDLNANFFNYRGIIPIRAYFDPNRYHVMLGDPFGQRMQADVYKADVGLAKVSLTATAYVAFGNDLPGIAPLPDRVEAFFGTGESPTSSAAAQDQRQGVYNRVASSANPGPIGGGDFMVLLGAGLKADLDISVPPLSIIGKGDLGFDAALFLNAKCVEDTKIAGLFGWYGEAQLYAYVSASIGISVDLWGAELGPYTLCGLSAGALFHGGLPNPTWAEGKLRAKGEVLGGRISFNASTNVAFGDRCKPRYDGDPLAKLVIIQELRPKSDKPVDTDATMAAVFNVNMNREYSLQLPDNTTRTYRFGLGGYSLTYTDKAGKPQTFRGLAAPVWANDDQLLLLPVNSGQLAGTRPHVFAVSATVEEKTPGGDFVFLNDGSNRRSETKSVAFTTKPQPDEIRVKDVAYQYPLDGQLYCLKGQVPQGLVAGPLPNEALEKTGRYEAVFVSKEPGPSLRVPFVYQTGNARYPSRVAFAFPPGLQNEKTYRLELHRITQAVLFEKTTIALNQGQSANQLQNKAQSAIQGTATVRTTTLGTDVSLRGNAIMTDKILYSFAFRTSRYNTFGEKVAALRFSPTSYANLSVPTRADYLTFDLEPAEQTENFEDVELKGYKSARMVVAPMLQPLPLAPIAETYPYEAWVTKNVYNPLLKFVLIGGATLSFDRFTELNGGGWLTNFPAAAMQSKRSRLLLSAKASTTFTSLSTPTSTQPGFALASTSATKTLLTANPGNLSMKVNSPVVAYQLDLFPLNDEPERGYSFFVQRDRISYFDWQAVNQFGTSLFTARDQARKLYDSSWLHELATVSVSASSPTITLSATYDDLTQMPNSLIDPYAVYPGSFGSANTFKSRAVGSTGGVLLRYVPYPDGSRQEVQKPFLFRGNTTPIATPR